MRAALSDGWGVEKSSDFCLRVADGTHDTPKPSEDGHPLITSKNLKGGQILFDGAYNISTTDFNAVNKRSKVDQWDVLFSMIGTVGEMALVRDDPHFAIKNIGLFKSRSRDDGMWLYYYLTSPLGQAALDTFLTGTSQQFVGLTDLRKVPVISPNPAAKRKIAAILTAYDDLIETNKRRITLLERMAEELYREWFVRMRFPGHENTKFVKGVPAGWPLEQFIKLVEMNPREPIHTGDSVPYVGMENLSQTSMHFVSNEKRAVASGSRFRNRDTLFPRITPCLENGKRGFVTCLEDEQVGLGSTEFIVFREKVLSAEYIYLLTCNASFRHHAELSMTGASGRQRVQHDCFDCFFIPTPPNSVRDQFVDITRPLFDSISQFASQITVLTETRDLLLPRLISGKLSVEDLDIQFPPSMQEEAVESRSKTETST